MNRACKLLCCCLVVFFGLASQEVVFVVPVQDLFPEKLSNHGIKNLHDYYNTYQSWSGFEKKYDCIRTAQVPMNTGGVLIEYDEKTGEACIQIDAMLVDVRGVLQPCKFWTLSYRECEGPEIVKKRPTFIVLDDENKKKYDTTAFPVRVRPDDISTLRSKNTLVLKQPWLDGATGKTYSVGTRLIRNSEKDIQEAYAVKLFDVCSGVVVTTMVPKNLARPCDEKLSDDERRALFNQLLQYWCCGEEGKIIPYVWGGGVIMKPVVDKGFALVDNYFAKIPVQYYERKDVGLPAGVDCSSLVLLAASVAGINYFYKTTSTLYRHGSSLKDFAQMQSGDIIVWQGHMVVIAHMQKNKESCIESLGYGAGAGKVREVPLAKRFKDIQAYRDLWESSTNKKSIEIFFANSSKVSQKIFEFKIVSLLGAGQDNKRSYL